MKKWIVVFVMCTLIACSALTINVAASVPTVRLPSATVYIKAEYGTDYWFDMTLTDVSLGQDITNGNYHGWCVQKDMKMSNAIHGVKLKSSYDFDNLSVGFQNIGRENWNKINYIINHRDVVSPIVSRNNTQMAIWNITDKVDLTNYSDSRALVNAANLYGQDFTPTIKEKLAVPIIGVDTIQLAFLELIVPGFEGLVWKDTNKDGLQNSNEQGLPGVTVSLYTSNGTLTQTTTTNSQGIYSFENVLPAEYYLQFTLKEGYTFSLQNVGADDTIDSDADNTGKTGTFTVVTNNETITIWDAGMYIPDSVVTPTPHEDVQPSHNVRPTADVSAGEPYRGFINSTITFNGSKSYDLEGGRIISYRWNFGDGSPNGTGEITTHLYAAPGDYNVSLLVTDNEFATSIDTTIVHITLGNNPPFVPEISGPLFGHARIPYQYTILATDPDGDTIRYIIDWGNGSLPETSPLFESGQNIQSTHLWATPGFYTIQAKAQDMYMENSSIITMRIAIDVLYLNDFGYLIDNNSDGTFDQYHNNATGTKTGVKLQNDNYLLDNNGDGTYDLIYNPTTDQTQPYSEQPLLVYAIIILAILVIVGLLIFYLMRKRGRPQ